MKPVVRSRDGFTLFELVLVIALMAILSSVAFISFEPDEQEALKAAARIVAGDLQLARSMAQQTGGPWSLQFDSSRSDYQFRFEGTGPPPNMFHPQQPTQLVHGLRTSLTRIGDAALGQHQFQLLGMRTASSLDPRDAITFQPLGGLGPMLVEDVEVWLGTSTGSRQVRLVVSWVTGQIWVDEPVTRGGGLNRDTIARLGRVLPDPSR